MRLVRRAARACGATELRMWSVERGGAVAAFDGPISVRALLAGERGSARPWTATAAVEGGGWTPVPAPAHGDAPGVVKSRPFRSWDVLALTPLRWAEAMGKCLDLTSKGFRRELLADGRQRVSGRGLEILAPSIEGVAARRARRLDAPAVVEGRGALELVRVSADRWRRVRTAARLAGADQLLVWSVSPREAVVMFGATRVVLRASGPHPWVSTALPGAALAEEGPSVLLRVRAGTVGLPPDAPSVAPVVGERALALVPQDAQAAVTAALALGAGPTAGERLADGRLRLIRGGVTVLSEAVTADLLG